MSLRGDDAIRTNTAQKSSLEEVGLPLGLEREVDFEFWAGEEGAYMAGKKGVVCLGRVSVGRRADCLELLRRLYHLS